MSKNDLFEYESRPIGYYDKIFNIGKVKKRGVQYTWHFIKFNTVKKNILKNNKHLDLACGPGTFIGNFLNNNAIGIDISQNQIDYAKKEYKRYSNNFFVADINTELPNVINQKFDSLTLLEFIEHISPKEVDSLINKLMKKLTKNGRIIITTPNYKGLWLTIEKFISIVGKVDYRSQHINRYTLARINEEFNYKSVTVKKYINFGIFFSFFSTNLAFKAHKLIAKLFNNFFGYSLIIIIENE